MRTSLNLLMTSVLLGCCLASSSMAQFVVSQQSQDNSGVPAVGGTDTMSGTYTPTQPNALYTNTIYSNQNAQGTPDPLAAQEQYSWQNGAVNSQGGNGGTDRVYGGSAYPGLNNCNSCGDVYGITSGRCSDAFCGQPLSCPGNNKRGLTLGKWYVTGWLEQGYTYNSDTPSDRQNGPFKYNDRNEEYQLNQFYLSMGRMAATSGHKWDIGGRVDVLYGADYFWTSAIGWETHRRDSAGLYQEDPTALPSRWNSNNGPRFAFGATPGSDGTASRFGLAVPQVYAEIYAPISYGLNVKAGHFYSIMGYESVMSPENFFYSRSYSMMYGEPITQTGLLFSQRISPHWTGIFGLTRGWDTFEDPNNKLSYTGGVRWASLDKRTEISFVGMTGNETVSNPYGPGNSFDGAIRSSYSLVFSHQLTSRLKLVTQHDLGYEKDAAYNIIDGRQIPINGNWYSVSQYIFYQLTDTLSFGARGEWFRDVNSARILRTYPIRNEMGGNVISEVDGTDYTQITLGLNWKPTSWLVIRPEGRWDYSDVCMKDGNGNPILGGVFDNFTAKKQITTSISAIMTY
ncbi:MAG: porin [Planctomycetaceae bacterium]|nr:porin [Planctomycetaceae bacterium]